MEGIYIVLDLLAGTALVAAVVACTILAIGSAVSVKDHPREALCYGLAAVSIVLLSLAVAWAVGREVESRLDPPAFNPQAAEAAYSEKERKTDGTAQTESK